MRQVILNRGNHKLIFIDKKIFISKNFSRGKTEESSISVSLHAYAPIKCPSIKFFYEIFHMLWKDGIITHLKQRHKMWNMPLKWPPFPTPPFTLATWEKSFAQCGFRQASEHTHCQRLDAAWVLSMCVPFASLFDVIEKVRAQCTNEF